MTRDTLYRNFGGELTPSTVDLGESDSSRSSSPRGERKTSVDDYDAKTARRVLWEIF